MTSWIRRGTGIAGDFLGRASMMSDVETRMRLAVAEITNQAEDLADRLLVQIERRAQLAVAEAKAFTEERTAAGRIDDDQRLQAAIATALAQVEAQLNALRAQAGRAMPQSFEPSTARLEPTVPEPLPYVAANGRVLAAADWSAPLSWRIDGPGRDDVAVELTRALSELGHTVSMGRGKSGPVPEALRHVTFATVSQDGVDRRIAVGFDWADSGLPLETIDWLNTQVAAVACLSTHAEKALIDHGCTVPTATMGLGIDRWERTERDAAYRAPGRAFRFLHVSSCGADQGVDVLLDAFGRVFAQDDDVSLVIAASGPVPEALVKDIAERRRLNPAYPDVVVLTEALSAGQLKALYGQCHVFAAPARASGFGVEIAQAFLSGLPVVVTAWGGHLDYCGPETAWLVDYAFARAQSKVGVLATVWAEPSAKDLDQALWLAYRADPAERFTKAWAGRKALVERYGWKDAALRLARLATAPRAATREGVRPSTIGFVNSWNTKCGIAGYVGHMLEPVAPTDYVIFADKAETQLRADDRNCLRTWTQGPLISNGLGAILPHLQPCGVEALIIQVNFGFYNPTEFEHLVDGALARGVVVLVELHSTIDPPQWIVPVKLADYAPALRKCHRVLAHSPADMSRLKKVGLTENLTLFPHGIIGVNQALFHERLVRDTPLIMSFGFALPNKGLVELVLAVGLLKNEGHQVRLKMLNAEYPSPISAQEIEKIRETIEKLDLKSDIELNTIYLEDKECIDLLGEADLIVNSYQVTGESASGSVRIGLASGAPVLVTPLPIFDELGDAVFRAEGTSPQQMARGIASALRELAGGTPVAANVRNAAHHLIEQHDIHRLGRRLMHMARGLAQAQRRDQ